MPPRIQIRSPGLTAAGCASAVARSHGLAELPSFLALPFGDTMKSRAPVRWIVETLTPDRHAAITPAPTTRPRKIADRARQINPERFDSSFAINASHLTAR